MFKELKFGKTAIQYNIAVEYVSSAMWSRQGAGLVRKAWTWRPTDADNNCYCLLRFNVLWTENVVFML